MALSMDEQRMLAEIERRLAAEDPGLAARLSSFRRPGPGTLLRSPRARIVGSVFTIALVAVISLMVYAMIPLRAHTGRTAFMTRPQASPASPVLTVPGARTPERAVAARISARTSPPDHGSTAVNRPVAGR